MKKFLTLLFAALMALSISGLFACSVKDENSEKPVAPTTDEEYLDYTFNESDNGYTVAVKNSAYLPSDVEIPSEYQGKQVIKIKEYGFNNCVNLVKVKLPESIEEIGDYAFGGCSSLKQIELPNGLSKIGNSAFYDCSELKDIVIPENVTEISDRAFAYCSSLKEIALPDLCERVGEYAFYKCTSLKTLILSESIRYLGYSAISDCKALSFNEFENGYYLGSENNRYVALIRAEVNGSSFKIHDDAYIIYSSAFENFGGEFSVQLGENIVFIGNNAFKNCSALTPFELPIHTQYIGDYAFYGCVEINTITIPSEVNYIGSYAFIKCPLEKAFFNEVNGWSVSKGNVQRSPKPEALADPDWAASTLSSTTYQDYIWYRK